MSIIDMYYYLFYKFHSFFQWLYPNKPGNKFRAVMLLLFLEVWLWFSVLNYWDILLQQRTTAEVLSLKMLIPMLVIVLLKWFAFTNDDRWKGYEQKFEQWTKEKNGKGAWVVVGITVFIIASSIISTYVRSDM